jgi:imidazoleglycerol phosphate dehydratase HisB
MRRTEQKRATKETNICVVLDFDGDASSEIDTGLPFFDHMLSAFGRHGRFGLAVTARGDLAVDSHHTIEDVGIVLGEAIKAAIGDGRGIRRFAHAIVPMDESRSTVAVDCGGRGYLLYEGSFSGKTVGGIDADIFEHFFYSLCTRAGITAHIMFAGRNDHHKCEAMFKAFGIALGQAVSFYGNDNVVPSTKGTF